MSNSRRLFALHVLDAVSKSVYLVRQKTRCGYSARFLRGGQASRHFGLVDSANSTKVTLSFLISYYSPIIKSRKMTFIKGRFATFCILGMKPHYDL